MRKNIRAADVTDWCDARVKESIEAINQENNYGDMRRISGKMEAYLEVRSLCERLLETETDEN